MKLSAAFVAIVLAACGGKSKPVTPPTDQTTETGTTDTKRETPESDPVDQPKDKPAPDNEALAQAALAEQYDAGKKVYAAKDCDSCHGDNGEGNPKNPAVIGAKAYPEKAPATAKLRKGVTF